MERVRIIDSHTGGEPTRAVIDGLPNLGPGSVADRLDVLKRDFDRYRTAVIGEPRSPSFAVGAYLLESSVADHGVVFFNNQGYLGMCGHGTIGVVATLAHLGRLQQGNVTFETPAGIVRASLNADGSASFENVASYRHAAEVEVRVPQLKAPLIGDVAYGGNWFFIAPFSGLSSCRTEFLVDLTTSIRDQLTEQGASGRNGARIDHVELVDTGDSAVSRNFVLCPGGEYDRSPCGTGTSARLACLYQQGKLKEGETYRVQSVTGSIFDGSIREEGDKLIPTITGHAYVNGECTLLMDSRDPFAWGIP